MYVYARVVATEFSVRSTVKLIIDLFDKFDLASVFLEIYASRLFLNVCTYSICRNIPRTYITKGDGATQDIKMQSIRRGGRILREGAARR